MKIALTGAATGIGAATAAKFKAQGHHVTAFDIAEPAAHIDRWIPIDLGDPSSIAQAVAQADGPYDALINNAGLPPREGLQEKVLQVNYFGLTRFLNAMLDHLADGAAIVNTASKAGAKWRENLAQVKALRALDVADLPAFIASENIDYVRAYDLSKEALIVDTIAQTEAMIARGLRMNTVSPAAVTTDILKDFAAAFGDRMVKNVARVGRPGQAQEVAEVIAFLAAPESGWIKGQDIVIDGGMTALAVSGALDL